MGKYRPNRFGCNFDSEKYSSFFLVFPFAREFFIRKFDSHAHFPVLLSVHSPHILLSLSTCHYTSLQSIGGAFNEITENELSNDKRKAKSNRFSGRIFFSALLIHVVENPHLFRGPSQLISPMLLLVSEILFALGCFGGAVIGRRRESYKLD